MLVWPGGAAIDRHVDRLLRIFRRSDQAAAFGFKLGALRSFQRLLAEIAQAGSGVAVGAGRGAGGGLALARTLLAFGCFFRPLAGFAFLDVSAHPFDLAFGLQASCFRYRFVGACRDGSTARAGCVGNLHLAVGQAAFVDFRTCWLGKQGGGEEDERRFAHDVFIA